MYLYPSSLFSFCNLFPVRVDIPVLTPEFIAEILNGSSNTFLLSDPINQQIIHNKQFQINCEFILSHLLEYFPIYAIFAFHSSRVDKLSPPEDLFTCSIFLFFHQNFFFCDPSDLQLCYFPFIVFSFIVFYFSLVSSVIQFILFSFQLFLVTSSLFSPLVVSSVTIRVYCLSPPRLVTLPQE